jgi:hypothetical protein
MKVPMNYKIKSVEALPNLHLKTIFENGDVRLYNVKPLQAQIPVFESFTNVPGLFERVHVDITKYAVTWNNELDIAAEEIWHNGRPE